MASESFASAIVADIDLTEQHLHQPTTPDRRALVFLSIGAIALVLAALAFRFVGADAARWLDGALIDANRAHVGLPVAIVIFCVTAFVGAPQALLIAACVFAFGATDGFWYSWIATIISGALTFHSGRATRIAPASTSNGAFVARLRTLVARNGFLASFAARFVPGPPFVVVNMALATAGARFWSYLAGLTIGVLPKTALIAFAGGSIGKVFDGEFAKAAVLGVAIALCVGVIIVVRRAIKADGARP